VSESNLKACPFCGAEAKVRYDGTCWFIGCKNQTCFVMPETVMWEKADAVEFWNRRAAPPKEQP